MRRTGYGLGIDAGGTYTDAVIMNFTNSQLIACRKSPTTQPDPSGGIRAVLDQIDAEPLSKVTMVSLATTFATNAIVEDKGAEAGLILIGYDELPLDIPHTTRVLMVKGGHTVSGEEKTPLDLAAVNAKLNSFLDGLNAVAITAFFSVRNPEHEIRLSELIRSRYDLPVVRGHRLSTRLDAFKRATTACWNARLIPLINNLIKSCKKVLSEKGIDAPLMVVRGDGTLMSAKTALDRPVDTLLSGPAASILGAKYLSGLSDALIVDMGGTTTDMAILSEGKVAIDPQGAKVGKWKTHVEAAKVKTVGIGGDSLIALNQDRSLSVGPQRVVPLCVIAEQHPRILEMFRTILISIDKVPCGRVHPCSFYFLNGLPSDRTNQPLPSYFKSGPLNEYLQFKDTCNWFSTQELERYERQGIVFRGSLTPTDIRVAAGHFELGNRQASQLGVAVFSKHLGMKESELIEAVEEKISKMLCLEAVSLVDEEKNQALAQLADRWFQPSFSNRKHAGLDVRVSLTVPVIGAGAPAAQCLPRTFERLHSECILPKAYEVSVAVGAVVGMVDRVFSAIIRPTDNGRFILHWDQGREEFDLLHVAIEEGHRRLELLAIEMMRQDQVTEPLLDLSIEEKKAKISSGEEIHIETQVRLRATGRPNVWQ